MLEIADEALGEQHEEADGSFRFGANRALVLNANGFFYSFAADRGGTGGVDLLALLYGLNPMTPSAVRMSGSTHIPGSAISVKISKTRKHPRPPATPSASPSSLRYGRRQSTSLTQPGWTYLTTARGLNPEGDDLAHIRWLPHAREERAPMPKARWSLR